jgi:hypothetical protein
MSPIALTGSIYNLDDVHSPEESPLQSPTFAKHRNVEQREAEFKKLMGKKYQSSQVIMEKDDPKRDQVAKERARSPSPKKNTARGSLIQNVDNNLHLRINSLRLNSQLETDNL